MKVDAEFVDARRDMDADWHDPAVPEMPPVPATDDPPPPADNFLAAHCFDGVHPPDKILDTIRPKTQTVNEEHPLKVDVCWSMRSPYSYLVLQRLVWLHSNYNVDMTIRPVLPIAVRSTKGGSGKAGGVFGVWYKLPDVLWDTYRMAQYEGVPYKWASPDPIWQTIHPINGEGYQAVHPPEKQPYIVWLTRLACYCQKHRRSLDYIFNVSSLIWGDHVDHWPDHVKERFNRIDGLDYDEAIEYIQANPEDVDSYWQENSRFQVQAGHGGVPLMVFNGEPFFGGDRFNPFFQRLRQNGLTERLEPRPPFTVKPLRWPDGM